MNKKEILNHSTQTLPYMTKIRRHIHQNPGCGFDNRETMDYIKSELEKMEISSEYVGKCGLSAVVGKGEKCFLLRADTDALEMAEEAELDFASANGRMHGCGHDMHAAMLLGAAKILKEHEHELCGCVKLMFQSAEELLEGARDMIDGGILENPKPFGGMMLHVMSGIPVRCGTVIVSAPGVSAPAADFFEITVRGRGCHGSSPSLGVDPVYAAASIVTALSEINSRELAITGGAALTIGAFNAGNAANVISDTAVLKGTLRCFDEEVRSFVKDRLREISEGIAKSFRASADVKFTSGCPSLLNDGGLCGFALGNLKGLLGQDGAISASDMSSGKGGARTSGSEDFAYVSREIPCVMAALAAGELDKGYKYPIHHPKVTFDEQAMIYGCAAFVSVAEKILEVKQ